MKLLLDTLKLLRDEGPWRKDTGICNNVSYISGHQTREELGRVFRKMKSCGLISNSNYPVKGHESQYLEDYRNKRLWKNRDRWKLLNLTIEFIENDCKPPAKEFLWIRLLRFWRW